MEDQGTTGKAVSTSSWTKSEAGPAERWRSIPIETPANRAWVAEKITLMLRGFATGDQSPSDLRTKVAFYVEHLQDYTEGDFHDGLAGAIRASGRFAPTVGEIRQHCDRVRAARHRAIGPDPAAPRILPPKPGTPNDRRAFATKLVEQFKAKVAERRAQAGEQTPFSVKKAEAQAAFDRWLAGERPPPLPTQGAPDGGKRLARALQLLETRE